MRLSRVTILILGICLGIALYFRLQLGIARYFDADEFAHLHWGYAFSIGELPYKDFFYLFPPLYLLPIATLFTLIGRSVSVLIAARVFSFFVFVGATLALMALVKMVRSWRIALLTACVFALIPMPYDKMLEVRPDLLSMGFMLAALYFFIRAQLTNHKRFMWAAGFAAALSVGIIPKAATSLWPAFLVMAYQFLQAASKGTMKKWSQKLLLLIIGGLIPLLIVIVFIVASGNPRQALLSITRLPKDSSAVLGRKFYMWPTHFFWPSDIFYAVGGFSEPYKVNLAIWWIALATWVVRFISSLSHDSKKRVLAEFVLGGAFFANLYTFIYIVPLRHSQYLITLAPFIAFYFADAVTTIAEKIGHLLSRLSGKHAQNQSLASVLCLVVVIYLLRVGYTMYSIKIKWTNADSMAKLSKILATIPKDEPIFDLTGETVMFADGYYVCCVPYGQYEEAIPFRLPSIKADIERRGTKYVHLGWKDRINALPLDHVRYIRDEFVDYNPDGSVMIKK